MKLEAKLIIDLGNSRNVAYVKFKSNSQNMGLGEEVKYKGGVKSVKFSLSNRFYRLPEGYQVPSNYSPSTTAICRLDGEYTGFYANGELVEREFEKQASKPTAKTPKYSMQSAISFQFILLKATKIIAEDYNVSVEDLDITWSVFAMLPAVNCTQTEIPKLEEEFRKTKSMRNFFTESGREENIKYEIGSVVVYPEGFAAYVGCIYNDDIEIRAGYEKYAEATVLLMDIGAGTTDIMVVSGGEIIDTTKETFSTGGNDVRAKLKKIVKQKYGYDRVLDSQLENAMVTGKLKDGSSNIDVSEDIMYAKGEVARSLVDDIQDYLDSVDFSIRSIEACLAVGGGTLKGEEGSKIGSISEFISENIKKYAPNIETMRLPVVSTQGGVKKTMSPRDMNVEGLLILSSVE